MPTRTRLVVFALAQLLAVLPCTEVRAAAEYTAATCSAADIRTALGRCKGDPGCTTVRLPACSGGANGSAWAAGDCVCMNDDKEYRIVGQGQDVTSLRYLDGARPPAGGCALGPCAGHSTKGAFMVELHGAGFKEFTGVGLSGAVDVGGDLLYVHGCEGMTDARIHHASFRKATGSFLYLCENLASVLLVDHVYLAERVGSPYGLRIHGNNDEASWPEPVVGFGSNTGVFVEDSVFDGTYHPVAGHGSARYTVRHNVIGNHSSALEGHGPSYGFGCIQSCTGGGTDAPCYQGVYRVEVYGNTFNAAGYSVFQRSGHWVVTDNVFNDQTAYDGPITVEMESSSIGTDCDVAHACPVATGWAGAGSCNPAGHPGCWQGPHVSYVWGNTFNRCGGSTAPCGTSPGDRNCTQVNDRGTGCIREGQELLFRAPQAGDREITSYSKFPYPHPLQATGVVPDAGMPIPGDAAIAQPDAGSVAGDGGSGPPVDADGCACTTAGGVLSGSLLGLLALGHLARCWSARRRG
jgi:hypothetical protein